MEKNIKKALVITGLTEQLHSLFPKMTKKEEKQVIVAKSFGAKMLQPYGCTVRSILLAVYTQDVNEIYIVGEKNSREHQIKGEELIAEIHKAGISRKTIETLDYVQAPGSTLSAWLEGSGSNEIKTTIAENVNLIKCHPLLPKTIAVYGFIVNSHTGEIEKVS